MAEISIRRTRRCLLRALNRRAVCAAEFKLQRAHGAAALWPAALFSTGSLTADRADVLITALSEMKNACGAQNGAALDVPHSQTPRRFPVPREVDMGHVIVFVIHPRRRSPLDKMIAPSRRLSRRL